MTDKELQKLRFPIGEFQFPDKISNTDINRWIKVIETFPEELKSLTQSLTPIQLNWKYRPNGWSVKQIVHHCADSHMNSIIRFKLTLTEDKPVIKPYFEDKWAALLDATEDDISYSQMLLTGLHKKWVLLLYSLNNHDLKQIFIHPEHNWEISLETNIALYAWHCEHHLAHIELAIGCKGQYN